MARSKSGMIAASLAVAAIAVVTPTYGDVIVFNNDGASPYVWGVIAGSSDLPYLDITQPASAQPGVSEAPGTFTHQYAPIGTSTIISGTDTELQVNTPYIAAFSAGQTVPNLFYLWGAGGFVCNPTGSHFVEGTEQYVGVHFDLGSGYQNGWIKVMREGAELKALAWAYETEPGVPITTPEPGTFAALALGAAVVGVARRRS